MARGKSNSEKNGVDFNASDEDGGFWDGDEWKKEMRRRVGEFEERRELEKMAEELQNQVDDDGEEGKEETEEEKRMRVKKELEKVRVCVCALFPALLIIN